jgi:hypothetical protein
MKRSGRASRRRKAYTKLLGDPGYLEIIRKAAELFVAGQTQDSFWRVM